MELEKEKKLNLTYMKQLMEDIKDFLMKKIAIIILHFSSLVFINPMSYLAIPSFKSIEKNVLYIPRSIESWV